MQRTDCLNIQCRSSFEKFLNLRTVFSNNSNIVTTCFAVPVLFYIKRTKFTKSVCGKQNLVCAIIGNHNFRPVYHRCKYKCKYMFAKCQAFTISNYQFSVTEIHTSEKVLHHGKSLSIGYNSYLRIGFDKILDIGCMIRFHMLYDQIIRLRTIQHICHIAKPLFCKMRIYSIHNCNLFVHDNIRVVRHTVRNIILSFKQIYLMIIDTYIINIISDFHCYHKPPHWSVLFISFIFLSVIQTVFHSLLNSLYPLFHMKSIVVHYIPDIFCQVFVFSLHIQKAAKIMISSLPSYYK